MMASPDSAPLFSMPISASELFPLVAVALAEAVKAVFMDRVNILSEYDRVVRARRSRCGCRA